VKYNCKDCDYQTDSTHSYGGHRRKHTPFENLKKDATRRDRLKLERGCKCEVCLLAEWCGQQIPIELDHIDGNPENNSKENLRLICPNCHAQTPNYKGRNIGKVQNSKRQTTMKKYYAKYR
jgi:hypothetical protein